MAQAVSRLALLMQILEVTGCEMALALDIDPSLISKWKRNRRRVPGRSDTMQKIASFLLDSDEKNGRLTIQPLLEKIAGGIPVSHEQSVELLTQWLLDPEPSDWYTNADNATQINLDQNGYTCSIDVFRGVAGRHEAVLDFFAKMQTLPADCQLMILMQEKSEWIDNNPEFLLQLKGCLSCWLTSGHRLEIIHWVDHQPAHLQSMLQNWLPLHLDAPVNSLYMPLFGQKMWPITLFLIPDQSALVGLQSETEPSEYHTVVYNDQASIRQFIWIYQHVKSSCQLLVENFQLHNMTDLINRFTENWHQTRNKYISLQSKLPLLIGISQENLRMILDDNGVAADRCEELLTQWSAYRRAKEAGSRIRLIHHLSEIEHAVNQTDYIDPFFSALVGQPIKIRQEFFREFLLRLGREVLENTSVEVALVRSETYNRSVWPNLLIVSSSFLTAWGNKLFQNRLFTQEATLVHAFENYFLDRWQLIPNVSRDRQVVSALLLELAVSPIENELV